MFSRLRVQTRLIVGFGAVLVMMLALTVIGISSVIAIDDTMKVITEVNSAKQRYAINFRGSVHDRAIAIRDVVLIQQDSDLDNALDEISRLESFYDDSRVLLDELMRDSSTSTEQNILASIVSIENKTLPLVEQVIRDVKGGDRASAEQLLLSTVRSDFVDWLAAINQFIEHQEEKNLLATEYVIETADGFQGIMLVLTGIACLISGIIVFRIVRMLNLALGGEPREVARLLSNVAEGDLTQKIRTCYENSVLSSVKKTQTQLSTTIINIVDASVGIHSQVDVVSSESSDILTRVQRQREYTAEATVNLDLISEKTHRVADLLVQTQENSSHILESCISGRNTVNATATEIENVLSTVSSALDKLQKLEQRTKDIGGIISVISGISDQTNLLALNAAIEAARAGESGRGFAVVADEVRTLAQSTGTATDEIETMLTEITKETADSVVAMESTVPKIKHGLSLSVESAQLLKKIEEQANNSLANVNEVVKESNEQIVSIDELHEAMKSVGEMADSSTDSLEKNNEVAYTLRSLANELKEQISYFKVTRVES